MRRYKIAYVGTVLLAGFSGIAAPLAYPDFELVLVSLNQVMLAILTYPLGFIASLIGAVLLHMGFLTPIETLFVLTPVYAALGYGQWFRLLPALYRRGE